MCKDVTDMACERLSDSSRLVYTPKEDVGSPVIQFGNRKNRQVMVFCPFIFIFTLNIHGPVV